MANPTANDYFAIVIGCKMDLENDTITRYVDGILKLNDIYPDHKSNLFKNIKSGKADWDRVREVLNGMRLRVTFNTEKLFGPYVFMTDAGLFEDENALVDWFESCPKQAYETIKSVSEVAGEGKSRG